jgi:hypothetical protein
MVSVPTEHPSAARRFLGAVLEYAGLSFPINLKPHTPPLSFFFGTFEHPIDLDYF